MPMKFVYSIFIFLAPCLAMCQPQSFRIANGCSYDEAEVDTDVYVFDASSEADRIVLEIVDALGLQKNFIVKSSSVPNALATTDGGKRYILYSTTFLEKFKADAATRWAAYSVLAHEIGHHLNGHDFSETDTRKRKLLELEADGFSGSVLRMLGATLAEAQAGIETFGLQGESQTHPAKTARREAIANGWKKRDEWLRERGQPAVPPEREETKPVSPATSQPSQLVTTKIPPMERCQLCPDMIPVEGGTFTMGCTDEQGAGCPEQEKPAHQVTVPGFYIGKYEVTQAEWKAVMGTNPSKFKDCDRCPVDNVTWNEAQEFIQKLNQQTGKNFRLPTEAEWEYAARGGQKSKGYLYAGDSRNLGLVAWWYGNSGRKTHPVGERKANELGIYDMSGNVWEWCADSWHDNFKGAPADGLEWSGRGVNGKRALRGGSWNNNAEDARSSARRESNYTNSNGYFGFRLAHGL